MEEEVIPLKHRGRPLKFTDVNELQKQIDAYFEFNKQFNEKGHWDGRSYYPMEVTDLAVWLDTSRRTLMDYQDREDFCNAIKGAKDKIEAYTAKYLLHGKNPTSGIFILTNGYGWENKQRNDNSNEVKGAVDFNIIMGSDFIKK